MLINAFPKRKPTVPFILKCGKALNDKKVEIRVQFKDVPGNTLFPDIARNELVVRIQPEEVGFCKAEDGRSPLQQTHTSPCVISQAVYIKMMNKSPGYNSAPKISELQLTYSRRYSDIRIPDAYETLMVDILRGDHSNFVRSDELAEAWRIFTPLLHTIEAAHPPKEGEKKTEEPAGNVFAGLVPGQKAHGVEVHPYKAGTRGPAGLDSFVSKFGFTTAPIPYDFKDEFK